MPHKYCDVKKPERLYAKISSMEKKETNTNKPKAGTVAIIGRPNVGKSTLLNNILGHKVSITSPKPQTTRFNIQAVYEDDRGQIIFVDTPGIFGKVHDVVSKAINPRAEEYVNSGVDVVIYLVDHTRKRDFEENKTLGIVRKMKAAKILVVNKIDIKKPTYINEYMFMEEEFDDVVHISGLTRYNLNSLLNAIYSRLKTREKIVETSELTQPALNMDSHTFIAEIIREKAYLFLRKEVPYSLMAVVDQLEERKNGVLYIKARILTSQDRYKGMIVGKGGYMIKEISMAARKELETATNKKIYLDLTVETDPHWTDYL